MPALGRSAAQGSKLRSGLQNSSTGSQSVRQNCVRMRACVHACVPGQACAEQGIELLPWQDQWGGMPCHEGGWLECCLSSSWDQLPAHLRGRGGRRGGGGKESHGASGLSWAQHVPQNPKVHVGLGGPLEALI